MFLLFLRLHRLLLPFKQKELNFVEFHACFDGIINVYIHLKPICQCHVLTAFCYLDVSKKRGQQTPQHHSKDSCWNRETQVNDHNNVKCT